MLAHIGTAQIKGDLTRLSTSTALGGLTPEQQGVGLSGQRQLDHTMGQGDAIATGTDTGTIRIKTVRLQDGTEIITLHHRRGSGHITAITRQMNSEQLRGTNTTERFT